MPCPYCRFFFHSPSQQQPFSMFSYTPLPEAWQLWIFPTKQQLQLKTNIPLVGSPLLKEPSKIDPFQKLTFPKPEASPSTVSPSYRARFTSLPQTTVQVSPVFLVGLWKQEDRSAFLISSLTSGFRIGNEKFLIFSGLVPSPMRMPDRLELSICPLASQHESSVLPIPVIIITLHNQRTMNKENTARTANTNRSIGHPSHESVSRDYRPSIKVGYKVVSHGEDSQKPKRRIEPVPHIDDRAPRRKLQQATALNAGRFVNSEYVKTEKSQPSFHKKRVTESHDKNQSSQAVKERITNQTISRRDRRSSSVATLAPRSVLPSYQQCGIKDIMEYQHAGKYREVAVTSKCTVSSVASRFRQFSEMHEYDFRKRPQHLR